MKTRQKWDYWAIPFDTTQAEAILTDELIKLGDDGWELVAIAGQGALQKAFLKRPADD